MTLRQRTATATVFDHTACSMFTMAAMFAPKRGQLKMPRPDAYPCLRAQLVHLKIRQDCFFAAVK